MPNEMTTTSPSELYRNIQDPLKAVEKMGEFFARSGMFGCDKVEQGMVLAMACLAEGRSPFDIKKTYHLIGGNLTMRADAMQAEFQRRGGKIVWKNYGDEGKEASALFTKDENKDILISYTEEEGKRQLGISGAFKPGSNWAKNPGAQLRARLISKAVRMLDPGCIAGVYTPEEAAEFEPRSTMKTVTAVVEADKSGEEQPAAPARKDNVIEREPTAARRPDPSDARTKKRPRFPAPGKPAEPTPESQEGDEEEAKEVEAVVEDAPAPAAKSEPAPDDPRAAAAAIAKKNGIEEEAVKWLRGNRWCGPTDGFEGISRQDAERICLKPDLFVTKVKNAEAIKPLKAYDDIPI